LSLRELWTIRLAEQLSKSLFFAFQNSFLVKFPVKSAAYHPRIPKGFFVF
jgi:hypothetical protein